MLNNFNYNNDIDYQKTYAETKIILRNKKKIKWINFTNSINNNIPISHLWYKIKIFSNKNSIVNYHNQISKAYRYDILKKIIHIYT